MDIEQTDSTNIERANNHNHNQYDDDNVNNNTEQHQQPDVNEVVQQHPPSDYSVPFIECKFWIHFATWPVVFMLLNGIVLYTLFMFSEDRESTAWQRRYDPYSTTIDNNAYGERDYSDAGETYNRMTYRYMTLAILCCVDAMVVHRAIHYLDTKIRAFDRMNERNGRDGSTSTVETDMNEIAPNVNAQVSRKLDRVLGRNPQSGVSILVSVLWLLFVSCGTLGLVSFADWLFLLSPMGKNNCMEKTIEFL
jgi:hypothetical protein